MNKLIYPRHVMTCGDGFMYVLSLAGEKIKSIKYQSKRQAFCEAELFKYYVRNRYGTKLSTMRPSLPEEDLREYTAEMGYELNPRSVEIHFPRKIKDLFVDYGAKIGRDLADLELPSTKQVIVRETLREARLERESLKRQRLELRDRLSKERAIIWRAAQNDASEAWKNAKIEVGLFNEMKECLQSALDVGYPENGWQTRADDLLQRIAERTLFGNTKKTPLGGVPITREKALEGLGDPATWDAEVKALYAEFTKKPDSGNHLDNTCLGFRPELSDISGRDNASTGIEEKS